jgi:cell division septum initiation protein DivIVA
VSEQQTRDRVKMILGGTTDDSMTSEHAVIVPNPVVHPDQALQVLTLAQRTAEEHVAGAQRHAEKMRDEAQGAADQIARDAQVYGHNVRSEAEKVLADARAAAEQAARDARACADEARRSADQIVGEARGSAESITGDARRHAEQLKQQAQQRYDDSVGSLVAKRAALQQQIEALEDFDRQYRSRLTSFMQGQMRALWADSPEVGNELTAPIEDLTRPGGPADLGLIPAGRSGKRHAV